MKLATYLHPRDNEQRIGVVDTERGEILDLLAAGYQFDQAQRYFATMVDLIEAGEEGLALAQKMVDEWQTAAIRSLASVQLLSPIPVPPQMRDCLVFEKHLSNAQIQWAKMTGKPAATIPDVWYERPTWYKCNRFSFVGHESTVTWPPYAEIMDFECELACVIGKPGHDIKQNDAASHIFGYTIFNDFSARDIQIVERPLGMGPMKSKDFDTGNVLGPWIVTADEIGEPANLRMEARVNGERWGGGNSGQMHHKFADIIAFISQSETLHAGELIASGTVTTGCGLELGRFLSPDDVVELEIEKIGVLRNWITRLT